MKKYKKLLIISTIMIIFISLFQNIVLGATAINKGDLIKGKVITTNVEFNGDNGWGPLDARYIYYKVGNSEYPAYCISHGLDGVDEVGGYTVDVNKLLTDNKIWRVIINGYPYKTPEEMGVANKYDAYVATKQGIYCAILNRDTKLYRGINEQGKNVVKAIENLKKIGISGTQTPKDANLQVNKKGDFIEDGNYYSQSYVVSSSVNISTYNVNKITNFPEGSFVADSKGNKKTSFTGGETFKIMIPKSKITQNINGTISVYSKCQTYPIFYRKNKNC